MDNLVFFNKEGKQLNFNWNSVLERYEGDILFHQNSTDTFKSNSIYTFEKVRGFEFFDDNISLRKFQLFNERGFHFYPGSINYKITKIEPFNFNGGEYSKWIYGDNFSDIFKLGTIIRFNNNIFEFTNPDMPYVIIGKKYGAILIISQSDNKSFSENYNWENPDLYVDIEISNINAIGIYDYINTDTFLGNLSPWNEVDFFERLFTDRKLNLVNNSVNGDKQLTIKSDKVLDLFHYDFRLENVSGDLEVHITLKSGNPVVYEGGLNLVNGRLTFTNGIPSILKIGKTFNIVSGNFFRKFTYGFIENLDDITESRKFISGDLVIKDGIVFECLQDYTYNLGDSPLIDNLDYWKVSKSIPVNEVSNNFNLLYSNIYLDDNKFIFSEKFDSSSIITISKFLERWRDYLKTLKLDAYIIDGILHIDTKYPSDYIDLKFYDDGIEVGKRITSYERVIEISEDLKYNLDYHYSQIKSQTVVIDRLVTKLSIKILNKFYESPIVFGQNSETTIHNTLKNWILINFNELIKLGIRPSLEVKYSNSGLFNSIEFLTDFPNVPIDIEVINNDFYFLDSLISFDLDRCSNFISLNINGRSYNILNKNLNSWLLNNRNVLKTFGVYVKLIGNKILLGRTSFTSQLIIDINVGISTAPGNPNFLIEKLFSGNLGTLITSNEIYYPGGELDNFLDLGLSTGQLIDIIGTPYTYQNTDFKIIYLRGDNIILNYKGPFWNTDDDICLKSPFTPIAFSDGFTQSFCLPQKSGEFNLDQFSNDFSLELSEINYNTNIFYSDILLDISSIDFIDKIITITENSIDIYESKTMIKKSIPFNFIGLNNSKILFNESSGLVIILYGDKYLILDPYLKSIIKFNEDLVSNFIDAQSIGGDIWITFGASGFIIYNSSMNIKTSINGDSWGITFDNSNKVFIQSNSSVKSYNLNGGFIKEYNIPTSNLGDTLIFDNLSNSIFGIGLNNLFKISDDILTIGPPTDNTFNNLIISDGNLNFSKSGNLSNLDRDFNINWSSISPNLYGFQSGNNYTSTICLSSQSPDFWIKIIDSFTGINKFTYQTSHQPGKTVYNGSRKSNLTIVYDKLVEIKQEFVFDFIESEPNKSDIGDGYGTLNSEYIFRPFLWFKAQDFIREPRFGFIGDSDTKLYWRWLSDNVPQFFFYDFSGDYLEKTGPLAYIGENPLDNPVLRREPNRDLEYISDSSKQQTIFDRIDYNLKKIDDLNIDLLSKSLDLFIGFKSEEEGGLRSIMQLFISEDVKMNINVLDNPLDRLYLINLEDRKGLIKLSENSNHNFLNKGFKIGQIVRINLKDLNGKYLSKNNGIVLIINNVFFKELEVSFISGEFVEESNVIDDNIKLIFDITVLDREIGRFFVYGQTENEDIRFKTELANSGKLINEDNLYIFKEWDIKEWGIDWNFLNSKRKEMLMVKDSIYPFIGSYKSIINAINYFGYNDLELYEYYRNIDEDSPNYLKLFKTEIPDIFNNEVIGWKDLDFLRDTFPNPDYESTNLLNLTFRITDSEGNYINNYTLDEVIRKLGGLKKWLSENIIPLTHKILDITGRTDFRSSPSIRHNLKGITIKKLSENLTPVTFKLNELYLMPVNNGSTVYNAVLDFFVLDDIDKPDYFDISIKTYEIYREWSPFKEYSKSDKIFYLDRVYQSAIDFNKLKNPRKYIDVENWIQSFNPNRPFNIYYQPGDLVNFRNRIYSNLGEDSLNPLLSENWVDITEWEEIDLKPIQTIKETRLIGDLSPYNFTIDSNIDPFIYIELTSYNGYGGVWCHKKTYEIRGIFDIGELESFTNLTSKTYRKNFIKKIKIN